MDLTCPQCRNGLPEVETLSYRFCPHCGAEIPTETDKRDNAFMTIPPDLSDRQPRRMAGVLSPPTDENVSTSGSGTDQTAEPQPPVKRPHPKINPPGTPPPTSFYRISSGKKEVPPFDPKQHPPVKSRKNVFIAILIGLVVVIVIMGGIFTF